MKKLSTLMITLLAGMTLLMADAEAKRFGGGKSFGKQYSFSGSKSTQSQSTSRTPQNNAQANPAVKSGASRWLGPLAGLAAGGLLAAMLFGDGFEGLQIMDILLFAGLIFGGMMLFKAMRRRAAPSPAGAGAPYQPSQGGMAYQADESAGGAAQPMDLTGEAPPWFDASAFVDGAKTHFIRLQAAWDKGDFRDIRDYTTPEMYAELQREYQRLDQDKHYTEVLTLNAELNDVRREDDQLVASVHFTGLLREDNAVEAGEVRELWHVVHDWNSAEGDWLIAGVQQIS